MLTHIAYKWQFSDLLNFLNLFLSIIFFCILITFLDNGQLYFRFTLCISSVTHLVGPSLLAMLFMLLFIITFARASLAEYPLVLLHHGLIIDVGRKITITYIPIVLVCLWIIYYFLKDFFSFIFTQGWKVLDILWFLRDANFSNY